jgi:hypothetical protein
LQPLMMSSHGQRDQWFLYYNAAYSAQILLSS